MQQGPNQAAKSGECWMTGINAGSSLEFVLTVRAASGVAESRIMAVLAILLH
jgi:hypothetical protein